ncbi:MAG TPA: DUF2911 domain-containing protein [Acidobacteriota bacterium]|nr:DUF2911 domain-containing protein [Acidobacteriota bacterium]
MRLRSSFSLSMVFASALIFAQSEPPPRGGAALRIDGKAVTIDYGRPALRGRKIVDLLSKLPPDRIWRAGDNQVTMLTTEGRISVGNAEVSRGIYSLYVHIPQDGDWSLVLNSDPGIELIKIYPKAPDRVAHAFWPRLDGYTKNIADKEVARVPMQKESVYSPIDLFTITLDPKGNGGLLKMSWGETSYSVDITPAK